MEGVAWNKRMFCCPIAWKVSYPQIINSRNTEVLNSVYSKSLGNSILEGSLLNAFGTRQVTKCVNQALLAQRDGPDLHIQIKKILKRGQPSKTHPQQDPELSASLQPWMNPQILSECAPWNAWIFLWVGWSSQYTSRSLDENVNIKDSVSSVSVYKREIGRQTD